MSGIHKGVQKFVRNVAPRAVYVHCYAHRLKVVLGDVSKSVLAARDFFALFEHIDVFTSVSLMHRMWMDVQRILSYRAS